MAATTPLCSFFLFFSIHCPPPIPPFLYTPPFAYTDPGNLKRAATESATERESTVSTLADSPPLSVPPSPSQFCLFSTSISHTHTHTLLLSSIKPRATLHTYEE